MQQVSIESESRQVDGNTHRRAIHWLFTALALQLAVTVVTQLLSTVLLELMWRENGIGEWHRTLRLVSYLTYILSLGCQVPVINGIHLWSKAHGGSPAGQRLRWARDATTVKMVVLLASWSVPFVLGRSSVSIPFLNVVMSASNLLVIITAQGLLYYAVHALVVSRASHCLPALKTAVVLFVVAEVVSIGMTFIRGDLTGSTEYHLGSTVLRLVLVVAHTVVFLNVLKGLKAVAWGSGTAESPTALPHPSSQAMTDLVVGGAVAAIGLAVTLWSFSAAPGGRAVIAYGAILYGLFRMGRGLFRRMEG